MEKQMGLKVISVQKWWMKIIGMLLSIIAIFQVYRHFKIHTHTEEAIDFRNIYLGANRMFQGNNPYDDQGLKTDWIQIRNQENLPQNVLPGLPDMSMLYPPPALVLFCPFVFMKYSISVLIFRLFLLLNWIVFSILIQRFLKQVYRIQFPLWMLTILVFACKPVMPSVWVGQPSVIYINLVFILILFIEKLPHYLKGIVFFTALGKPSIGILGFANAIRSKKSMIYLGLALLLFLTSLYFLPREYQASLTRQYEGLSAAYSPMAENHPYTINAMSNTHLQSAFILITANNVMPKITAIVLFVFCVFISFKNQGKYLNHPALLLPLAFSGVLVLMYHKYYDLLLLMPFACVWLISGNKTLKLWSLIFLIHILVPYNVFNSIGFPVMLANTLQFLNSWLPLLLLVLLILNGSGIKITARGQQMTD